MFESPCAQQYGNYHFNVPSACASHAAATLLVVQKVARCCTSAHAHPQLLQVLQRCCTGRVCGAVLPNRLRGSSAVLTVSFNALMSRVLHHASRAGVPLRSPAQGCPKPAALPQWTPRHGALSRHTQPAGSSGMSSPVGQENRPVIRAVPPVLLPSAPSKVLSDKDVELRPLNDVPAKWRPLLSKAQSLWPVPCHSPRPGARATPRQTLPSIRRWHRRR
jgi:hypothetical protein